MNTQGVQPETRQGPGQSTSDRRVVKVGSINERSARALRVGRASSLSRMKHWAGEHKSEIFWAATFAVLVAWFIDPSKPKPYTIYVVTDHSTDPRTMAVFHSIEQSSLTDSVSVGDVPCK
jgi:hypothetical protein